MKKNIEKMVCCKREEGKGKRRRRRRKGRMNNNRSIWMERKEYGRKDEME